MKWIGILTLALCYHSSHTQAPSSTPSSPTPSPATDDPPEGYYAFVESPNAEPPRVRPPPYSHTNLDCREDAGEEDNNNHRRGQGQGAVSVFNLCGDLNRGTIPRNPMGQNVLGSPYPFELIKNMTLKYLSRTLPILKADDTLPKVAQLQDDLISQNTISNSYNNNDRVKRDTKAVSQPIETATKSSSNPSEKPSQAIPKIDSLSTKQPQGNVPFSLNTETASAAATTSTRQSGNLEEDNESSVKPITDTSPKYSSKFSDSQSNPILTSSSSFARQSRNLEDRLEEASAVTPRQSRKFCDQGGVFCMLYKAINGEGGSTSGPGKTIQVGGGGGGAVQHMPVERRDDVSVGGGSGGPPPRYEGPPTPCPAKVEYATPVFAKNYQGVWRYVVQIPYEGYFTQTLEVTRCLQSRCHYLDGGCLSSPRWHSLLVAEIYYPDTVLASPENANNPPRSPVQASQPPSVQDFQNYQQYLHKRAGLQADRVDGASTTTKPAHCDGVDALGCFQVRLYYDWFLVPGSCKCWRPDYFNKYVRRKTSSPDL